MTTARFSAHIYRASGHGKGVTITSGEAARRGVFLSQAMQGEEDALAQDHTHDGRLGERDAGPFASLSPGPAVGGGGAPDQRSGGLTSPVGVSLRGSSSRSISSRRAAHWSECLMPSVTSYWAHQPSRRSARPARV
jgi:hypothetical protein